LLNGNEKNLGAENTWNDLLPKFEYIGARKHADKLDGGYKITNEVGKLLSDLIESISEENESYKAFISAFESFFDGDFAEQRKSIENGITSMLQEQFPDCGKVDFKIKTPAFEDLIKKLEINIDDGVETSYKDKGDSMQRALMLSIIRYYSNYIREKDVKGESIIFCIDEAELHLHPMAQRSLKDALHQISQGSDQVFINTYSSVLIADNAKNQKIFKVHKLDKITQTEEINEKQSIIYDLLGGLPTDLLFPNNFLIVEGHSEAIFLNAVIQRLYAEDKKIQIINAKSDGAIRAENTTIERIFDNLSDNDVYKDKVVAIKDKSKKENSNHQELSDKIKDRLFILTETGLENYYPAKYRE
jgi:putative ATP-dependent endonuclease of OLD family